jgi:hypothetical protein
MIVLGILSVLFALASIAAGAIDVARAVNPAWLSGVNSQLYQLPSVVPALALAIVAIILIIICRSIARGRTKRRYGTSGAIVGSIFGILLAVVALMLTNIFPNGVISSSPQDTKLASNAKLAEQEIEKVTGTCESGWKTVDVEQYPGVNAVVYCKSNKVAFAGFSNPTAANLYRAPLQSKALDYITSKLSDSEIAKLGDFNSLSGGQWIIVGPTSSAEKLQKQMGGTTADVSLNASDD